MKEDQGASDDLHSAGRQATRHASAHYRLVLDTLSDSGPLVSPYYPPPKTVISRGDTLSVAGSGCWQRVRIRDVGNRACMPGNSLGLAAPGTLVELPAKRRRRGMS